jgi:hypothetical protein
MTVATATSKNIHIGNGATSTYSYTFKIFADSELLVTVRDTDGEETTLTKTTDYTVTGVGATSGGTIGLVSSGQAWLTGGNLTQDYVITIRRKRPLLQTTDIRNSGGYYPSVHEDTYDKLVMNDQQQQDELDRSVRLPETVAVADFDPILPAAFAGQPDVTLIANSTGDGFAVGPTTTAIFAAAASAGASADAAAADAAASAAAAATSAADAASSAADAAAASTDAAAAAISAAAAAASATAAATSEANAAASEAAAAASVTAATDHIADTSDAHNASAISYDNATSGLTATDVQAAIDEVVAAVGGGNAASLAYNNAASGLTATDVQAAVDEVEARVDSLEANTGLADHIADTVDAHDASAISNTPSGNLAATDVQTALNELQADVDTRAPSSDLATHIADTSTHGVTSALVGVSETQVLSNKSFSDAITFSEISTPSNPSAGSRKLYAKTDGIYHLDSSGNEQKVGAGTGGNGGINHISNSDAETNASGWATYADAASALPVDGTGGSANITIARSTSSPLRGTASFLITKDAANRQGQGTSFDFSIDRADASRNVTVSFDYSTSGTFVAGDSSDLRVYLYDVTNSALIYANGLYGETIKAGSGRYSATFGLSSSTSYRLILHVATTSAAAWTFKFDNVKVSPVEEVQGAIVSDWRPFTLSVTATSANPTKGTIVRDEARYRRVGDSVEIEWHYRQNAAGANGTGDYLFNLPSGLQIDTSKLSIALGSSDASPAVGTGGWNNATDENFQIRLVPHSTTALRAYYQNTSSAPTVIGSGAGFGSTNWSMSFRARVPILGWSSNVTIASSSTFRVSHILVNGTRVTSAPTKLGEYRAYRKNASANTGTDDAPGAATQPTMANGMGVYGSISFAGAGGAGETGRWEIFVGKNKHVKFEFFSSTGRTGYLSTDIGPYGSNASLYGLHKEYDSSTGVAIVDGIIQSTATTGRYAGMGIATAGGGITEVGLAYFDIIVSENAQAVGVERSQWIEYTQTVEAVTSNPTKASSPIVDKAYYRYNDGNLELRWDYVAGNSGATNGSGTYLFPLPSGFAVDSAKVQVNTDWNSGSLVGDAVWNNVLSTRTLTAIFTPYSSTKLQARYQSAGPYTTAISSSNGLASAGGWTMSMRASFPAVRTGG